MSYQPVFSTPSSPSNKASYAPSPVKSSLRAYNIDLSIRIDEQESPRIQKISCRLDESDAYRPARQPPDKQPPVIFKPKFSTLERRSKSTEAAAGGGGTGIVRRRTMGAGDDPRPWYSTNCDGSHPGQGKEMKKPSVLHIAAPVDIDDSIPFIDADPPPKPLRSFAARPVQFEEGTTLEPPKKTRNSSWDGPRSTFSSGQSEEIDNKPKIPSWTPSREMFEEPKPARKVSREVPKVSASPVFSIAKNKEEIKKPSILAQNYKAEEKEVVRITPWRAQEISQSREGTLERRKAPASQLETVRPWNPENYGPGTESIIQWEKVKPSEAVVESGRRLWDRAEPVNVDREGEVRASRVISTEEVEKSKPPPTRTNVEASRRPWEHSWKEPSLQRAENPPRLSTVPSKPLWDTDLTVSDPQPFPEKVYSIAGPSKKGIAPSTPPENGVPSWKVHGDSSFPSKSPPEEPKGSFTFKMAQITPITISDEPSSPPKTERTSILKAKPLHAASAADRGLDYMDLPDIPIAMPKGKLSPGTDPVKRKPSRDLSIIGKHSRQDSGYRSPLEGDDDEAEAGEAGDFDWGDEQLNKSARRCVLTEKGEIIAIFYLF